MHKGLWLLLLSLLSGCATPVPPALAPDIVPKAFTDSAAVGSKVWPEVSWWRSFGDDQLTTFVTEARDNNRDLSVAAARVMQAQAVSTIQRSSLFPQVGAQTDWQGSRCRGESCSRYLNADLFGLQLNASYELDFWGLARENLRAANEQLKAARFAQESVALTITANVATSYLNILGTRRRIVIARQNVAAINAILDVIKLRVKAGSVSHLDLAREQAQLEFVEAQLPSLETSEKQAIYSLAVLLGRPASAFEVVPADLEKVLPPALAAGLPSELLLRRPDVAQAEASLASAHANVDAARAAFLPRISLTGQGGFVSAALGTLLNGSSFGYAWGAELLQTIFDGGRLSGQKDLAEGIQKEYVASYQKAVLNAYADVELALIQVANTGRSEAHLRQLIDAAQEAFQISELQYRQGAADLLTVLQAQQTLFSAKDQLVQTMTANRVASIHLYEALGGGWVENVDDRTQVVQAPTVARNPRDTDH